MAETIHNTGIYADARARENTAPAHSPTDELINKLCEGYAWSNPRAFRKQLAAGEFEVWQLTATSYALIAWPYTHRYGKVMNILTIVGDESQFEDGILALDRIALEQGANVIYSVGHCGWLPLLKRHGYETQRMLSMKKEIVRGNSVS